MKLSQISTQTHGARLSVLFVFLLMMLPMMKSWAQVKEKEETLAEILSKVTIDTIQIKATPY